MRLFGPVRRFLQDRRGNALMIAALAMPLIVGAAGVGVHSVQLSLTKREMQRQADSAALAGGYSLFQAKGGTVATAAANDSLARNPLVSNITSTVTPTGSYTSGSTTFPWTMYVSLTHTEPTPFMALFGHPNALITVAARAATVPQGKFCFLALEPGTTTGVIFAGNANINLGCGVAAKSKSGIGAIKANGNSGTVIASPLVAEGTVENASIFSQSVQISNSAPLANPFAGNSYDPPNNLLSNGNCKSGNSWNSISVASGASATYTSSTMPYASVATNSWCLGSLNVQGNVTLPSGTYYIANGANNAGLQVGAQGHLTCASCTFVLTSTTPNDANSFATMSINGGAELDLSAPTSGTYNGITIYRDSRAASATQQVNGNANSTLSGAFYFPNDHLTFNGTSGMTVTCFQMVAKQLEFSGNTSINNSCTDMPGGPDKWAINSVRLIS